MPRMMNNYSTPTLKQSPTLAYVIQTYNSPVFRGRTNRTNYTLRMILWAGGTQSALIQLPAQCNKCHSSSLRTTHYYTSKHCKPQSTRKHPVLKHYTPNTYTSEVFSGRRNPPRAAIPRNKPSHLSTRAPRFTSPPVIHRRPRSRTRTPPTCLSTTTADSTPILQLPCQLPSRALTMVPHGRGGRGAGLRSMEGSWRAEYCVFGFGVCVELGWAWCGTVAVPSEVHVLK